jgi:hypothetical protein
VPTSPTTTIHRTSRELLKVTVTADHDITGSTLHLAVIPWPLEAEADTTWQAATTWDGTTARLLVGPPGLTLTEGVYRVWIRIQDTPEQPVFPAAGVLLVT